MAAAGTVKGLRTTSGEIKHLTQGGADYVALIIYMPTDVENEANYKTSDTTDPLKYAPSIELGVNLYATQVENEEDSFGSDYDSASELPVVVEGILDENAEAPVLLSKEGKSVSVPAYATPGK